MFEVLVCKGKGCMYNNQPYYASIRFDTKDWSSILINNLYLPDIANDYTSKK